MSRTEIHFPGPGGFIAELASSGDHVDLNTTDQRGTPWLHCAAQHDCRRSIDILISHDAFVDFKDKYGRTALHIAVQSGKAMAIKTLLNLGADINIRSKNGRNPIDDFYYCCYTSCSMSYNFNFENDDRIERILSEHIFKLKIAGFYVHEKNYKSACCYLNGDYKSADDDTKFENRCKLEIENLKKEKLGDVSLYDILTKQKYLDLYVRNEEILRGFYSNNYWHKFPLYAHMINAKLYRGKKKSAGMEKIRAHGSYEILRLLPMDCWEEIMFFLDEYDLKLLAAACCI
ncbi:serine/threonine-protein phosphatase 6 regulatory ankyrin repeat subunit C-like [Microplitis mediator]|uniref:serine/threonine-protein phosphatase 6 regulatory ankyrin repeat subunit C-like n=1 Tax=Microplitis mediator TaxID=375433 RepID=UPI0025529455|nr:serine/threonine-protein phosphatase 6 regulatory ankyrin repeat subunit C-like [Microplitis mediator]